MQRDNGKRALEARSRMTLPEAVNQRCLLDFVSDGLFSGRRFRPVAVVDDCTRERLRLVVDTSLSNPRVGRELSQIAEQRLRDGRYRNVAGRRASARHRCEGDGHAVGEAVTGTYGRDQPFDSWEATRLPEASRPIQPASN